MLRSHEPVRTAVARRVNEPGLAYTWSPSALSDPRGVRPPWEPTGSAQRDRSAQDSWLESRAAEAERRAREEAAALHLLMDANAVDGLELVERAQPRTQHLLAAAQATQGWLASGTDSWRTGPALAQRTTEHSSTARVAELLAVAAQVEDEAAVAAGGAAAPPTPAALVLRSWSQVEDKAAASGWSDRQLELSPLKSTQQRAETGQHGDERDSRPVGAPPAAAPVSVPALLSRSSSSASTADSMMEEARGDTDDAGARHDARLMMEEHPRVGADDAGARPSSSLVHRSDSSASFVNAPLDFTPEPSDTADFGPIPCPAPEPAMESARALPLARARAPTGVDATQPSRPSMPHLAAFPPSFVPQPSPEPGDGEKVSNAPVAPPHTAPPPPPPLEVQHARHLQAPPVPEVMRISSASTQPHWRSEQAAEPGTPRPLSPRASLDGAGPSSFKRAPPMDAPAEAEQAPPQPLPRGVPATMRPYVEASARHPGGASAGAGVAWSTPGFLYDADGDMRRCTVEWRSDRVAAVDEGALLWSLPYAQIEALWWSAHPEEEDGDVLVCAVDSSRDGRLCVRQRDAMLGAVCSHWAAVLRGWRLMAEPTSDDPRPHGGDPQAGGFQLVLAQPESSSSNDDDSESD